MATLKTNTLTGTSTAGSIAVTAEGNSTTTNLQQGLDKMWVFFDGTQSSSYIQDSFNTSGFTDNTNGDYTIAIANDMASINYAYNLTVAQFRQSTPSSNFRGHGYPTVTASTIRINTVYIDATDGTAAIIDTGDVNMSIKGDLA